MHPTLTQTGAAGNYTPKTQDEADGSVVGLIVPYVIAQPPAAQTRLGIAAATLVKAGASRTVRVNVTVAGTMPGGLYDAAAVTGLVNGALVAAIPNAVGSYLLDWPHAAGIVVAPGLAQVVSVQFI